MSERTPTLVVFVGERAGVPAHLLEALRDQGAVLLELNESAFGVDICEELCAALPPVSGKDRPPEWITVIPKAGEFRGRDGRRYVNDRGRELVESYNAAGEDQPLDINHIIPLRSGKGEDAPAIGWFKELRLASGGAIEGRVEWNTEGAAVLASRKYRYLSPGLLVDPSTRSILGFSGGGLTNRPNIRMEALNSEGADRKETLMLAKLLKALGLSDTATEEEALNAVAKLRKNEELNAQGRVDLHTYIPRADHNLVLEELNTLKAENAARARTEFEDARAALLDKAIKEKRISPASRKIYEELCTGQADLKKIEELLAVNPQIAGDSGLDGKTPPAEELNAEGSEIFGAFGVTAEEVKKYSAK